MAKRFFTRDMRYWVPTSSRSMPDSDAPHPTNCTAKLGGGPRGASRHCQLAHSVPEPKTGNKAVSCYPLCQPTTGALGNMTHQANFKVLIETLSNKILCLYIYILEIQ